MAKSDLLKEAIADAKAVKETALANAKIALQEAFAPRLERMLATKLTNEIEGEDEEMPVEEPVAGIEAGEEMAPEGDGLDVGDLSIDVNNDGEFDEFDIYSRAGEEGAGEELPAESEEELNAEYDEPVEEDLNLEAIIRELEGDLEMPAEEMPAVEKDPMAMEGMYSEEDEDPTDMMGESIDEIIEAILREEDEMPEEEKEEAPEDVTEQLQTELEEAYNTVKQLKSIINEVNLLNAKLLFTNKLFRNFELSENQKMKVIENFDRAGNTREVKLVFTTLAESFKRPELKKRVVKESYASKATATTAPAKETTQVLSEGFELANRWKKLAGLL